MKRAGVIGNPIGHTLSPTLFKAAFEATGIEGSYEAWQTLPEELGARVDGLRDGGVFGANVTIPHKEAVIPMLDRLDERAERVGAVNTIANEAGDLVGYNTDVPGFARALREDAGLDPKGKRAIVLGSGGAARAVALALIEGGASTIVVTGPIVPQLMKLVDDLRGIGGTGVMITWTYWGDGTFLRVLADADLVVNCTPVGMSGGDAEGQSPVAAEHLPANGVVFDLVYNPQETPLLKAAKDRGLKTASGLGMLVRQAAESFRIWTGQEAPLERMLEAGREALAEVHTR